MNETLRKRLTGAVVLIALGILLPFVLSQWLSDPAPVDEDSVRVYEITPRGEARPIADPEPDADTSSEPPPAVPESPPRKDETAAAGTEATPEPEPEPPTESEPAEESWAVQVGSFRSEENAQGLTDELSADFPAFYTKSEVGGVAYYRVRVGPYADEQQARRAAEALIERGRNAQMLKYRHD